MQLLLFVILSRTPWKPVADPLWSADRSLKTAELYFLFTHLCIYLLTYELTRSPPQLYDLRKFERENVVPYFGAGLRTLIARVEGGLTPSTRICGPVHTRLRLFRPILLLSRAPNPQLSNVLKSSRRQTYLLVNVSRDALA